MPAEPLHDKARAFLEAARHAGADEADVLAIASRSLRAHVRNGTLEHLERAEGRDFGLRVFVGGASAVVSGSTDTGDDFATLAERAVAMARTSPPDPGLHLLEPAASTAGTDGLELSDTHDPTPDELFELAAQAEAAALAVKGVTRPDGSSAGGGRRQVVLVNSRGFSGTYARTGFSLSVSAIAGEGTAMERDYDYTSAVHLADMEAPAAVGRRAGERAVKALAPVKITSRKCPVVFENRIAGSFPGLLARAVNGASIVRGTSFLKEKLASQVFRKGIAIVDDPLRPRGLASRPFDAEGQATAPLDVVADGVLESWLLDGRSAGKLGLANTAHASRSTGAQPAPAPTNLHLEAGSMSLAELVRDVGEGVLITSMFSSGVNMVTGDYSRGASGFLIEAGEITSPVSEITIAGNLVDMFAALVPAGDLEFRGSINAPSVCVEGMTVAGA